MARPAQRLRRALARVATAWVGAFALVVSVAVAPAQAASVDQSAAQPATLSTAAAAAVTGFDPGHIMSDAVFFDKTTMSEAQIQSFLQTRVPSCQSGYTCLKDWYDTSRTTTADAMCGAYSGGTRERASRIIYKVAQACGINPQVILATLQKEQGLVTHTWPSEWRYTIAMGQGCPDTAACDTRYYGFFNQVFGAAWQFKRYANPPGTSQFFTWYAPGKTWNILYHPNRDCGTSPVFVRNQATSNLYYYTPYQPNAAALRAGFGTGDGCSSYGNRNFYNYFTDWFGSTQVRVNACAQPPSSQVSAAAGEFAVTAGALNARSAPSTDCEPVRRSLSSGDIVTRVATWGEWWSIRYDRGLYWVHSDYVTPAPPVDYTVDRLTGRDRYETSAEVSRATYPDGTEVVLIASGEVFPDALTSSAVAGRFGASLLLTEVGGPRDYVRVELQRLSPSRIVIVGGEDRVSSQAMAELGALVPDATVERITGRDRFETSRLLAAEFFPTATDVYLATGAAFPDAIVASAAGATQGRAVILVNGGQSTASAATVESLRATGVKRITIVGGADRVSDGIESSLRGEGFEVIRVSGRDRYETSRLLVAGLYPSGASGALLATGENFPDALVGGVLAAQSGVPLLTTPTHCLDHATKDWLIAADVASVTLLGDIPSLDQSVAASVRC